MNIDKVISRRIMENLEEVLDAVPPLSSDMQEEVEFFSRDFCEKVLIDFYNCPDLSKKTPEKILEVLFDGALLIRGLLDTCGNDFELRQITVNSLVMSYDVWADGRIEKLIKNDAEYMDYSITKQLAIEETIALCRDEFGIELHEDCGIKCQMSVLTAFVQFCFRITFELVRI